MIDAGTILYVGPAGCLDEHDDLEHLGHEIVACTGRGARGTCPLVEDGWCPTVDAADGVIFRLDLDDPYHRALLRCYRDELGEDSPLRVVVRPGQEDLHADLLAGLDVGIGGFGRIEGFSSQVTMAAAARRGTAGVGDPTRSSARRFGPRLGWV